MTTESSAHTVSETGCALHIVHVSSGRGIRLVTAARERGINVSCETCTHYLALTEDDVEALGVVAKCAPLLRSQAEQDAVLQAADLFYRHQHSPYVGKMLHGRVARTMIRGRTVVLHGKVVAKAGGRLVRPSL